MESEPLTNSVIPGVGFNKQIAVIRQLEGNAIEFGIEESETAQLQTEYKVYITELSDLLYSYGFKLATRYPAMEQKFLNLHENKLTSLYTYGKFQKN